VRQLEIRKGDATGLAVLDDSIDVVISNGVLNLVPEKERGFAEIIRLLKPGGCLHLADIALQVALPEDARRNDNLWSGRIAGALPETNLLRYLAQIGLEQVRITKRFDLTASA
jgi:ubiquinone/menaquinone biosynthesis C-methylase UbiE